jgi:hypothetical protein
MPVHDSVPQGEETPITRESLLVLQGAACAAGVQKSFSRSFLLANRTAAISS